MCCVSVSDLEFVSMFPSARGECFNGDVATLECSQVENGEAETGAESAECDHKDKDKDKAREVASLPHCCCCCNGAPVKLELECGQRSALLLL